MDDSLTTVRNIGPAMAAALRRAGVASASDLRALGTDAAYARLLASGTHRPHFIAYYTLEMGLQGRPWNDCKGAEKDRLRARFDALCAQHLPEPGSAALERLLDDIGVVAVRPAPKPDTPT
ncbi:MAG: TfoX/Sxy family DNA transformation protein [Rhodobacteraceae bacterium]|nr:TfoX/Sxy family DNA transformation protein [Paracoccaceae bacterium]